MEQLLQDKKAKLRHFPWIRIWSMLIDQ